MKVQAYPKKHLGKRHSDKVVRHPCFTLKQVGAVAKKLTGNVNSNGFGVWQMHRQSKVISIDAKRFMIYALPCVCK